MTLLTAATLAPLGVLDRANHTGLQAESTVTNLVTDLASKAPLASPAFTGTPTGITKAHVGLGSAVNTSDVDKPISSATQAALDLQSTSITSGLAARPVLNIYTAGAYPARPSADLVLWMGPVLPGGTFGPSDVWLPTGGPGVQVPDGVASISTAAVALGVADRAFYVRFSNPQTSIRRYIGWEVTTSAGSVEVALLRLTGAGLSGTGGTAYERVATTGVVLAPAAGILRTDLGVQVLTPGEYVVAIWGSDATLAGRFVTAGTNAAWARLGAHASGLVGGIPATGTIAWNGSYVACTVLGDI